MNNLYFGHYSDFFFEFIPQMLWMGCIFGYMVLCIVLKWSYDWIGNNQKPPSIISIFTGLTALV